MLRLFLLSLLIIPLAVPAQIIEPLLPINTKEVSPLGLEQFRWACVANFELASPQKQAKIKFLDTDKQGNIYIIDQYSQLYALDGNDFSKKWMVKLSQDHVVNMAASPDGKTIAISYDISKCPTKKLDLLRADNGRLLTKVKRTPSCYTASYFEDVLDNTTLYPTDMAYSPDGSKLAVWFKNHGFDDKQCKAKLVEEIVILNPTNGHIIASRNHIAEDFDGQKCAWSYTFIWGNQGDHLYIGNCRAQIVKYAATDLNPIKKADLRADIQKVLTEKFEEKANKKLKFPLHELAVQQNGDIIFGGGKNGQIFKIDPDLLQVNYITQNQEAYEGVCSFSPDYSMIMFNADHINLWDVNAKHPVLYLKTPQTFDAHTVRFHPNKQAILVGTGKYIKLLAPCALSEIHINDTFTPTGHFLNSETAFSVRGKGNIYWSFDDNEIHHKYSKEDEISTEPLGFSSLHNNNQQIPSPSELRIRTDNPGIYTIFGGTMQRMTDLEILQSLEDWK